MTPYRIALANLHYPASPEESISLATDAIAEAARQQASILCFPECFIPGYPHPTEPAPPPTPEFLDRAHTAVASAAAQARITVILGTERYIGHARYLTALVVNNDGSIAGWQDKVQLDPVEDSSYTPASGRRLFQSGPLTFGIVICHEGFRYPETTRWAARNGAQIVFHPHFDWPHPSGFMPQQFADPQNTFHEKAMLCRAAENNVYFASVNCAIPGAPTTSAIVRPDGTLLSHHPHGEHGLLIADLDLAQATGLLASRLRGEGFASLRGQGG
jgi:predicted amidohydrolase